MGIFEETSSNNDQSSAVSKNLKFFFQLGQYLQNFTKLLFQYSNEKNTAQ